MAIKLGVLALIWLYESKAWCLDGEADLNYSLLKSLLVLGAIFALFIFLKLKVIPKNERRPQSGYLKLLDSLQLSATHRLLVLELEGKRKLVGMSQAGFFLLEDSNDR